MEGSNEEQLGRAFRRVRYSYHQRFFFLLAEHLENEAATLASSLAALFDQVWLLCQKRATTDELEDHYPTVLALKEPALVESFISWEPSLQQRFLRALQQTLTEEAEGDQSRGRTRLASLLREAAQQIDSLSSY